MTEEVTCKVVESPGFGKIVLAARNVLPGEIVSSEKATLWTESESVLGSMTQLKMDYSNVVDDYDRLSLEIKSKVDDLFHSKAGPKSQEIDGRCLVFKQADAGFYEKLVKIQKIVCFNAFGSDTSSNLCVGATTRFKHSCIPNCSYSVHEDHTVTVRCIRPVNVGAEMTLSYVPVEDKLSTHERRHVMLRSKEFLCKCSRCAALGDDTRQFNCFNQRCTGRHLVCQPTNYEGCEPFLLPCTKCKRVPTGEQERSLFQLEAKLSEYTAIMETIDKAEREKRPLTAGEKNRVQEIADAVQCASHHAAARKTFFLICKFFSLRMQYDKSIPLFEHHIDVLDGIYFQHPSTSLAMFYHQSGVFMNVLVGESPVAVHEHARDCMRKSIRMRKMLMGRECKDEVQDSMTERFLIQKIGMLMGPHEMPSVDHCNFCHETPANAFMHSSRCGACRRVMYCSKACQTAHWPLHKPMCKVMVKSAKTGKPQFGTFQI